MAAGASSLSVRSAETERGRIHGRWLGRAQARATVHETMQGFFLRDLGYERNSFCELTTVKIGHRKLATGRQLGRSSMVAGMASGGASTPRTPPAATVLVGDPPPSNESVQESSVRRLDSSITARQWRLGFGQIRTR
jgi:hypothetical protein